LLVATFGFSQAKISGKVIDEKTIPFKVPMYLLKVRMMAPQPMKKVNLHLQLLKMEPRF